MKLIFSICIVGIHTQVLVNTSDAVQWYVTHLLFRLGVPFFFCVSGYFLGCKLWNDNNYEKIFKKYRKRLIPPFLVWGGIGLFQYAISMYISGIDFVGIIVRLARTMIFYPKGAMWYVGACILATYILQLFWKKKKGEIYLWVIGIAGYLFALTANTYYFLIDDTLYGKVVTLYLKVCVSARNGLFVGLIFMYIGIVMVKLKDSGKKFDNYAKYIFIFSLVVYIVEVHWTYGKNVADDSALFLSHLTLIPSGIVLALNNNIKESFITKESRGLSTCIYFTHACFNNLIGYFVSEGVVSFLVVLTLCISVYIFQKKYKNKYLEKIL